MIRLLLMVACLASCQGPTSSDAHAVVQGRKDLTWLEDVANLAVFVDRSASPVGPVTPAGQPSEIRVQLVDGAWANRHRVELSPGPHVLQIAAKRTDPNTGEVERTLVNLALEAEPGVQYRLAGRRSKRQAPWSIEVQRGSPSETVASSEPSYAELDLPPLPGDIPFSASSVVNHAQGVADGWELADWGLWADYEFALHEPTTLRGAKPSEQLERSRVIRDERLTLSDVQYRRQRQMQKAGRKVDLEPLAGQPGWIERWETIGAEEPIPRMGVAIHRQDGDWIHSMVYSTWKGRDAEERCLAWEERLLACMGIGVRPQAHVSAQGG